MNSQKSTSHVRKCIEVHVLGRKELESKFNNFLSYGLVGNSHNQWALCSVNPLNVCQYRLYCATKQLIQSYLPPYSLVECRLCRETPLANGNDSGQCQNRHNLTLVHQTHTRSEYSDPGKCHLGPMRTGLEKTWSLFFHQPVRGWLHRCPGFRLLGA